MYKNILRRNIKDMERRISGHTQLYALIGSPVGHSGSPAMYNYSFEKLGIDAAYLAFDVPVDKTKDAIDALRTLHAGGFNVTMPCKTATAQIVDRLSPAAELVGACNTVVIEEDGTMTGHMTDGTGFVRNLKEHGVDIKGKKIVLLGTGGAATAIAVQAALDGVAEIAIFNRKDEFYANGEKTVEKIRKAVPSIQNVYIEDLDNTELLGQVIGQSDILINATRAGMSPMEDVIPVPAEFLTDQESKRSRLLCGCRRKRHAPLAGSGCIRAVYRTGDACRGSSGEILRLKEY